MWGVTGDETSPCLVNSDMIMHSHTGGGEDTESVKGEIAWIYSWAEIVFPPEEVRYGWSKY